MGNLHSEGRIPAVSYTHLDVYKRQVFIPSMGLFFLSDLLGGSKSVLAGGLIQRLINSRDLPLAAALSVLLLSVTGAVIAVYRKLGGSGDMSMF